MPGGVQYRKRRKLCADFIRAIRAGSGLSAIKVYRTIKISHTCIFVHKNPHKQKKRFKKIHITSIVGVSSIKTYNIVGEVEGTHKLVNVRIHVERVMSAVRQHFSILSATGVLPKENGCEQNRWNYCVRFFVLLKVYVMVSCHFNSLALNCIIVIIKMSVTV